MVAAEVVHMDDKRTQGDQQVAELDVDKVFSPEMEAEVSRRVLGLRRHGLEDLLSD
jgi:hypothetical protein